MQRTASLEKTLMLGEIEGRRRWWQRMRWLDGVTDSMEMSLSKLSSGSWCGQGSLACCSPWSHKESGTTEQLNWQSLRKNISLSKMTCFVVLSLALGLKTVSLKDCCHNNSMFKEKHLMWLRGSNAGKKKQFVLFSSLRAWDSFLLKGPRLLINLPKNELSHCFFDDLLIFPL